jgi:hypothetical protein
MNEPSSPAAINRALLVQLACDPDPHVATAQPAWAEPARRTAAWIRERLTAHGDVHGVDFDELHRWRTSLDEALDLMQHHDPAQYRHWRQPGTWLDNLLRLRSLLAHVLAKAYWNDAPAVSYDAMDVPRFLWGAR